MVSKEGSKAGKTTKRPSLKYFFINNQIHQKLHIDRGKDKLSAWNYPEHKRVVYNYSWVLRHMKPAYPTSQVAKLLNRTVRSIQLYMAEGAIPDPPHTYDYTKDNPQKIAKYMWREEDIMAMHEYIATTKHQGRERLDGEMTNNTIPTPRELRALLAEDAVLYVKQGDKFVPSWKAKEI
jgi:hypothetical protein